MLADGASPSAEEVPNHSIRNPTCSLLRTYIFVVSGARVQRVFNFSQRKLVLGPRYRALHLGSLRKMRYPSCRNITFIHSGEQSNGGGYSTAQTQWIQEATLTLARHRHHPFLAPCNAAHAAPRSSARRSRRRIRDAARHRSRATPKIPLARTLLARLRNALEFRDRGKTSLNNAHDVRGWAYKTGRTDNVPDKEPALRLPQQHNLLHRRPRLTAMNPTPINSILLKLFEVVVRAPPTKDEQGRHDMPTYLTCT